jgi:type IV pilus assembly protein PilM
LAKFEVNIMWKRLFSRKKAKWLVGLQMSPYALRLADVRAKSSILVRKHETIPIQHGTMENYRVRDREWLAFELEKKVKEWRWKGREAVLSIPLPVVVIRKLTIPKVPEKEIIGLIDIEIENTLHLPFSDPVFDYVKLPDEYVKATGTSSEQESEESSIQEKLHLLIVAAPRDTVQSYVDVARSAGLKPVAVDVEPLALYRTLHEEWPAINNSGTMLLHITLSGVDVAIFTQGIPEFFRHIPLPAPFFNEWDAVESIELGKQAVRHMEQNGQFNGYVHDLFAEITRITNFYQYSMYEGKQKVEQICLTGDFGDLFRLVSYLKERFSIPVHTSSYERIVAEDVNFSASSYAVAVGLGAKDVSDL